MNVNLNFLKHFQNGIDLKFNVWRYLKDPSSIFICSEFDNNFLLRLDELESSLAIFYKDVDYLENNNTNDFNKKLVEFAIKYCYDFKTCEYVFDNTSLNILTYSLFSFNKYSVNYYNSLVIKSFFDILKKKIVFALTHHKVPLFNSDSDSDSDSKFEFEFEPILNDSCICTPSNYSDICNCCGTKIKYKCRYCSKYDICLHCGYYRYVFEEYTKFTCIIQYYNLMKNTYSDFFNKKFSEFLCSNCTNLIEK